MANTPERPMAELPPLPEPDGHMEIRRVGRHDLIVDAYRAHTMREYATSALRAAQKRIEGLEANSRSDEDLALYVQEHVAAALREVATNCGPGCCCMAGCAKERAVLLAPMVDTEALTKAQERAASLEAALAELVAVKDLKDRLKVATPQSMWEHAANGNGWGEYRRRKPLAWARARALSHPADSEDGSPHG